MKLRQTAVKAADHMPAGLAPWLRSDSRIARFVRPMANRVLPKGESVVAVRSGPGQGLRLPIDVQVEKYYWTGNHERHVQDALVRNLGPGMCFWDVGAHIGFLTAIAARLVGETGSVIAFEPMPDTRQRLGETVSLNGFHNVSVSSSAVTDSAGTRTLRPPLEKVRGSEDLDSAEFTTMWTLVDEKGVEGGIPVECHRLDDLPRSAASPDLIKIDAEGAEIEVLAGGLELLAQRKTKVIIEMSDDETLARGRALLPDFNFEHIGENHWLIS